MAPVGGADLIAERSDADVALVATSGQATRLAVDELGFLKVTTADGVGTMKLDSASAGLVHDAVNRRLLEELLLTVRAILNHNRAIASAQGVTVSESDPL